MSRRRIASAIPQLAIVLGLGLAACTDSSAGQTAAANEGKAPGATTGTPTTTTGKGTLTEEEALRLGTEAYIFGYPLVLMDVTERVLTNVPAPDPKTGRAPVNDFAHFAAFPGPEDKTLASPNVDTLYSSAWLNLSREPMVLHVPDTKGRYYLMPVLDAWTNVISSPGKRTTGTKAGNFAIVGPSFKGTLPREMTEIRCPTDKAWIVGRIQTNGTADIAAVNALQKQFKLMPLSSFGTAMAPVKGVASDPSIDSNTPPVDQVTRMDANTFFRRLSTALKANPPVAADAPMVTKLERLGIVPGQEFDPTKLDAAAARGLARSVANAQEKMTAHAKNLGAVENGWRIDRHLGSYGTSYLDRATVAATGIGANLPQDALYPYATEDSEGRALNGSSKYVVHFPKGQTPPVNAFWSVTMYNPNHTLYANPQQRYALGSRDKLKPNADGSVDIYLSNQAPKGKEANWLPAPDGPFNVILRMYWPKQEAIDGTWKLPTIQRAS